MAYNYALGNIIREVPVVLTSVDFTDENGFFIRASTDGNIKYCPVGNGDAEAITKTVDATAYFIDPVLCRKVFKIGTTATVYAGYGV